MLVDKTGSGPLSLSIAAGACYLRGQAIPLRRLVVAGPYKTPNRARIPMNDVNTSSTGLLRVPDGPLMVGAAPAGAGHLRLSMIVPTYNEAKNIR